MAFVWGFFSGYSVLDVVTSAIPFTSTSSTDKFSNFTLNFKQIIYTDERLSLSMFLIQTALFYGPPSLEVGMWCNRNLKESTRSFLRIFIDLEKLINKQKVVTSHPGGQM